MLACNIGKKVCLLLQNRKAFSICWLLLFKLLFQSACAAQSDSEPDRVLRSIEQINKLPAEELSKVYRVDLQCIVTCYEPDWAILFVHDGQRGGYAGNIQGLALHRGDRVRIRGMLSPVRVPVGLTIEPSDNGLELPVPKPVDFAWLQAGKDDSQPVEMEGQFIGIDYEQHQICLEFMSSDGGRFRGLIHETRVDREQLTPLLGKTLKLRGIVGARFDKSDRWSGFQLWLTNPNNVELAPNQNSSIIPIVPISELTADRILERQSFYFRTQGQLTYQLSPSMLMLQDEKYQIFIEPLKPGKFTLDRAYEVSGTLDTSVFPPILRMAELQSIDHLIQVNRQAVFQSIEDLVVGDYSGRIVKTTGTYFGNLQLKDQNGFLMEHKGNLLPVILGNETLNRDVVAGTRVDVQGVWVQQKSLVGFNIGSCALYARSSGVVFGTQIPWILLTVVGIAFVVTAATSIWAITLRQQVQRKTQQVLDSVALQHQTEERYAGIFINAQVMVMTADETGTITTVNPAVLRLTKLPKNRLLGSKLASLVTEESRAALEELLINSKKSDQIANCQVSLVIGDKKPVPQEVSCWITRQNAEINYHLIWHDITERLQMELQRAEMEQRMLAMQKMESLGVLAGGIAHDFNNLLTVILGNASLLSATELSSDQAERVAGIEDGATRASELTEQMLAYAGRGRFDIRVVSLSLIVAEMSQLLQATANKSVSLQFELNHQIPGVKADATQLKQILLNLVRNASEAMEGREGCIHLRSYCVQDLPEAEHGMLTVNFLQPNCEPANGFVCLEIQDNGCGIDESSLRSVFDPFYSTKFSGRGLGLSTVMGIVRGHQGCIWVKSTKNCGTTFQVYLPTCSDPITQIVRSTSSETVPVTKLHALVVDDEPAVLQVLASTLQVLGIRVTACHDGVDALRLLSNDQIKLDCLITDQTMPKISGIELCEHARRVRPNLPTILCSGFSIDWANSSGGKECVSASIQKPFLPSQLAKLVISAVNETNAHQDVNS
ncbi:MAG: ATP-binding protein [Pirellulales bacterium]